MAGLLRAVAHQAPARHKDQGLQCLRSRSGQSSPPVPHTLVVTTSATRVLAKQTEGPVLGHRGGLALQLPGVTRPLLKIDCKTPGQGAP